MRFVDLFLSLQTNSSQISYQIVCLRLTGSDAPSQTYIKVYCYVLYITDKQGFYHSSPKSGCTCCHHNMYMYNIICTYYDDSMCSRLLGYCDFTSQTIALNIYICICVADIERGTEHINYKS